MTFDVSNKISYYDGEYDEERQIEIDAGSLTLYIIIDIVNALLCMKFGTLLIKVSKPTI